MSIRKDPLLLILTLLMIASLLSGFLVGRYSVSSKYAVVNIAEFIQKLPVEKMDSVMPVVQARIVKTAEDYNVLVITGHKMQYHRKDSKIVDKTEEILNGL